MYTKCPKPRNIQNFRLAWIISDFGHSNNTIRIVVPFSNSSLRQTVQAFGHKNKFCTVDVRNSNVRFGKPKKTQLGFQTFGPLGRFNRLVILQSRAENRTSGLANRTKKRPDFERPAIGRPVPYKFVRISDIQYIQLQTSEIRT